AGAGIDRLREVLVPLQGIALPAEVWERDVLPRRTGAYSPTWLDQLCSSGEVVWVGAGSLGRNSGKVALYFREDAEAIGPPPRRGPGAGARTLGTDLDDLQKRGRARPAPPDAGGAAARALRHRHPRARPRRGHPGRLLDALRQLRHAGDPRRLPPRLLRRGV